MKRDSPSTLAAKSKFTASLYSRHPKNVNFLHVQKSVFSVYSNRSQIKHFWVKTLIIGHDGFKKLQIYADLKKGKLSDTMPPKRVIAKFTCIGNRYFQGRFEKIIFLSILSLKYVVWNQPFFNNVPHDLTEEKARLVLGLTVFKITPAPGL
jgi:hypothetical protein